MSFEDFIESLGLSHFSQSEFLVATDRPLNELPPASLWHNIALPAAVLDRLRGDLGEPITITSCYRAPAYNSKIGGSPRSQHQAFAAIDFKVRNFSPAFVVERLQAWRSSATLFRIPVRIERLPFGSPPAPFKEVETWDRRGDPGTMLRWVGGLGLYPTFIHVDGRGENATWSEA